MLKQRVVTACVLVCVLLGVLLLLPPIGFLLVSALALCLGAWEWSSLSGLGSARARLAYTATLPLLLFLLTRIAPPLTTGLLLLSLAWWLLALFLVWTYPRFSGLWHRRGVLLPAGWLVLLPPWLGLLYLHGSAGYVYHVLLFLALVAAADIGAYFTGRRFGRHQLAPRVSPNKTWEGLAGGQLAATLVLWSCLAGLALRGQGLRLDQALLASLGTVLLAAFSVVGDLFESMLKRQVQVKDSGTLLPGHGGMLDRLDSITAALPLFALVLLVTGLA